MPELSQRHRSSALPFPYSSDGLDFELAEYTLDGSDGGEIDLKAGELEIDLTGHGAIGSPEGDHPWERATLSGHIEVPESVVETVFPEDERAEPPAKLYVTVRCHDTIYRDRVMVSAGPTPAGKYDVDVDLEWSNLRGKVELRPYLVRRDPGAEESEYASNPNVRVADGEIYTILVDAWERDERAFIDGEQASFSESAHLPDGEKLYYLDFRNESNPKLWINADNPRIADVLQSEGSVGAEPRMRDVILDQISYGIWTQLIVRTATAVGPDGEVDYEWQRTVIDSFGRRLYDVTDSSDAALRLRDEINDTQRLPHLMERIDGELQEFVDPRSQLINLMEEGLQI